MIKLRSVKRWERWILFVRQTRKRGERLADLKNRSDKHSWRMLLQYGLVRPKENQKGGAKAKAGPGSSSKIRLPTASVFIIDMDKRIRICHHYTPAVGKWDTHTASHMMLLSIGPMRTIHLSLSISSHVYVCIGRNFYEIVRAIDALQLVFFHQVGR